MKSNSYLLKVKRNRFEEPEDFSIRKFSCFDFFTSINSFVEHNFSGAIKVDFPKSCSGYVHISPRGFSAFVRLFLSEIYGNTLTVAKVFSTDTEVVISISENIPLSSRSLLISLATKSGFAFSERDGCILLATPLTKSQEVFVFATEKLELINYIYEAFLHE